jgi:hypothetical protein
VFLSHGLLLGIFLAMAVVSAMALWRHGRRQGRLAAPWLLAALWLLVVLVFSKNLGALVLAVAFLPVLLLLGVRGQLMAAGLVALVMLGYPVVRGAGLVPTEAAVELAARIDPDRAQSLEFRFNNEDMLLEHARRKPISGWGGWGRNRVYDGDGNDISVTDGAWVIILGFTGWVGYVAQFGLLGLPIVLLMLGRRRLALTPATAGLALVMAVNLIDLVPNASVSPVTWLIGGALAGCYARARAGAGAGAEAEAPQTTPRMAAMASRGAAAPAPALPAGPRYTRFPAGRGAG